MVERPIDKFRRKVHEFHERIVKLVIRKAVRKLDELNYGAFMDYTFEGDERTTYHVIAERHLANCHVYGTRVEYYDEGDKCDAGT